MSNPNKASAPLGAPDENGATPPSYKDIYQQQPVVAPAGGFLAQPPYPQQPYPSTQGYPYHSQSAYPATAQQVQGAPMAAPQIAPGYPAYPPQGAVNQGVVRGGYDSDVEGNPQRWGGTDEGNSGFQLFSDKAVRRGFIRKVYGILMVQLIVTGAMMSLFMFVEPVKQFTRRNRYLYWVAFGIMLTCMVAMACCVGVRRKAPTNYVFLGVFTMAEGFMLGTVATYFQVDAVLIAVGICAAVTMGLTLFAFQTKYDFTTCGGMLCGLVMILFVAGIIVAIFPSKAAMIGYGSAGALIFSMYIVYDTQMMMGGKHKYSLDPEEYVFASLNLYLDIINLFMYLLMIIGAVRSD